MTTETITVYLYDGKILKREQLEERLSDDESSKLARESGKEVFEILNEHLADDRAFNAFERNIQEIIKSVEHQELTPTEYDIALVTGRLPRKSLQLKHVTKVVTPDIKSMTVSSDKDNHEDDMDDSFQNCFGLINDDAEDSYSKLLRPYKAGKGTIADLIESNDKLTVEHCRELLSTITSEAYITKHRAQFFRLNYRLSHLGVAPRWRGINRDKHYKGIKGKVEPTADQKAFLRDTQVFDLQWVFSRYHGHLVDTSWNGAIEGIFTSDTFDSKKAAIIAELAISPAKKADYLMLTSVMQKELFFLRNKATDDFINRLLNESMRMSNDLRNCGKRNKRRGLNLERIKIRVDLWLASKLIPGSTNAMTRETYKLITGTELGKANCERIISSMNAALKEVNSKHVLS